MPKVFGSPEISFNLIVYNAQVNEEVLSLERRLCGKKVKKYPDVNRFQFQYELRMSTGCLLTEREETALLYLIFFLTNISNTCSIQRNMRNVCTIYSAVGKFTRKLFNSF